MIALIRAFSKTIFARILLGVLAIAMAGFGLQGVFSDSLSTAVITAGDRQTSPQEFNRIWGRIRQQEEQRQGRPVTSDEMVAQNAHRAIADDLATRNSFAYWLQTARVRPSDTLLAERIAQIPDFFNPVTNAFDEKAFADVLARNGLTKKNFDREIRDEIATGHLGMGMAAGLRAPRIYSAMQVAYQMERRDITWFAVTDRIAGIPAAPTDAQLTTFINENKERLRRPEFRQLTLVLFRPANYGRQVAIDEAAVRRIYESRKAQLAQAERRTFTQITVNNPQIAPRVAAALRANQDPATVARQVGGQIIQWDDKPQTSVPDAAVAQAAFSMTVGQVSNPIRGQLGGISIVKLSNIAPGHEVPFEEARGPIEQAMRAEEAGQKVFDAVQKYEEARAAGATLEAAARQVGAEVRSLPFAVSDTGLTQQGQRVGAPDAVFKAAFDLPPGGESDSAEEAGQGAYFVVRVDKVIPPGLPTIAADRGMLTGAWIGLEVDKRMRAKSAELMARIARGETVAAVAASAGAQVQTTAGLERARHPLFSPQFLGEVFLKKPGEAFNTRLGPPNPRMVLPPYIVGKVDAVRTPPTVIAARTTEDARPVVSQAIVREMAELAQAYARDKVKPRIREDRIDRIVGATSADAPPPPGKKK